MMDYDVSYKFEQAKSIYCKVFSEAKTNSRYLQTVQQPLESLISGTLRDISITFPSLINTLRSIFHYNMYFRSEKRILGFLSRISSALHTRICIHLSNAMNSLVCCMRDSTWSLIDIENNLSAFTGVECRFSCKLKVNRIDVIIIIIAFHFAHFPFVGDMKLSNLDTRSRLSGCSHPFPSSQLYFPNFQTISRFFTQIS